MMQKMVGKFTSEDGKKLTLHCKPSKRGGFNVSATMKVAGEPARTGCRSSHDEEAAAKAKFERLRSDAQKAGWTPVAPKVKSAFTSIPMARNGKRAA